jgi:RNA 3'-terminal phosphate cyclase (ATP)
LPRHIPERQIGSAIATLEKKGIRYLKHKSILENSESPGSSILVYATSESGIYLGADSIGEKGIKAEIIGNRAAKKFIDNYEFRACIDQHLADMLVLPLSFVDGKSRYKISRITKHLLTNLEVIKMLNSIEYHFEKISENEFILSIEGNSVI